MGARARDDAGAVSAAGALTGTLLIGGSVALAMLLGVPARVAALGADGYARFVHPTTDAAYGDAVQLSAGSGTPGLELVAGAPHRVVSATRGQHALAGNVLVGAPLTIRNVGEVAWSSAAGLEVHAVDSRGASYALRSQVTATRGAHALALPASVLPGRSVRGELVFEVPRSVEITTVSVTVGSQRAHTAEWSAGD